MHRTCRILPLATSSPLFVRSARVSRRNSASAQNVNRISCAFSTTTKSGDPFMILGIPRTSDFKTIKAAFLKAALQHHPDHSKSPDSIAFIRVQRAFETIVQKGRKSGKQEVEDVPTDYGEWIHEETGDYLKFDMNRETELEVVKEYKRMTNSAGKALRGGYWDMARQLTERHDRGESEPADQQLSAGNTVSSSTGLRRKRPR